MNCGSYGCIECYAGARGLIIQGRKLKSKIISRLTGGKIDRLTPKIVQEAAILGDAGAKRIWKGTALGHLV